MTFKKSAALALCAVSAFGVSTRGFAQSAVDGAIGGNVEDTAGAVVANATVVVRNNGNNAEVTATTDGSGFFRVIHLQPGVYTIHIAASGFEAFNASRVVVEVGSLTDPHARLTIGAATETVQVTGEPALINTTSNDFAQVINERQLDNLPVANYRWSSYALLTPGVVADQSGFGLISFRGQSTLLNNVTFDGTDDNQAYFSEERGRTRVGYSTAKASIQEFQVNTSNYSVEYGRSAGGVVNAVTRSGTNEFHGEAYFYDRDAKFFSLNPFVTHAVQVSSSPVVYQSQVFKPKDWRKQSGIGIGGPIIKDKLFFFFAFDDYQRNFPLVSIPNNPASFVATPDAALPSGTTCATTTLSTIDAATCQLAAGLNHIAPIVAGGKIVAPNYTLATTTQYAAAATTYTQGLQGLISETGLAPRTGDQTIWFPKIDYQINGKNHLSIEVNRLRWTSPNGIQTGVGALTNSIDGIGNDFVKSTFVVGKLDTAITSKIANEARYQYGRDFEIETNNNPTPYTQSTLLTPPGYSNPFGIAPNVSIPNAPTLGTPTFLNRAAYPDERRWQIADTINIVRGNNNFKFGGDFINTYDLLNNLAGQFGGFSYSTTTTGAGNALNGNTTGTAANNNNTGIANYLTDVNTTNGCFNVNTTTNVVTPQECYTGYLQEFGPAGTDFNQFDFSLFAQDEWKIKPRLSLTIGVRYEKEELPGIQFPNVDLDTKLANPAYNLSGYKGNTSNLPTQTGNFGPRIGFAFDVYGTGKTVLRGGYGEFFARLIDSTIYNALIQDGSTKGQFQLNYASSLANPLAPKSFPQIISPSANPTPLAGGSANFFDQNFKLPEIHQADLTIDQELGHGLTAEVTWLSSFGRRLSDFVDANLPLATTTKTYTVNDATLKGPLVPGSTFTIPYYTGARPIPGYGTVTDIFSGVNSNYEALVGRLTQRVTNGLQFDINYTWSHALDYGENSTVGSNGNVLLDPHNLHADYGNSNFNVPQRLVMNAVYETPSIFKGFLGQVLNDYEIAPSYQAQTGLPYSINTSGTNLGGVLNTINGSGGANRIGDRNLLKFPRTQTFDARVSKRFAVNVLDHKTSLEILAEGFNLANHLNVTNVNTSAYVYSAGNNGTGVLAFNNLFGTRTNGNSTVNYPVRQLQFGARVQF